MPRVKTFDATGIAPNGRLYAGDLNSIQDWVLDNDEERAFVQRTTDFNFARSTEATAAIIVSFPSITCAGETIIVEFSAPEIIPADKDFDLFTLWDGATDLGVLGQHGGAGIGVPQVRLPVRLRTRITPSAGVHTFHIKGHDSGAGGTGTQGILRAGAGSGAGVYFPAFGVIRDTLKV